MAYDASGEERFTRQKVPPERGTTPRGVQVHDRNHGWYWLFAIPFVFTLLPWIYNKNSPELFGMPFFYWSQFAFVLVGVGSVAVVYVRTRDEPVPEAVAAQFDVDELDERTAGQGGAR